MSVLLSAAALAEPTLETPESTPHPAEMERAMRAYEASTKKNDQQNATARTTLRDWYAASLKTMREEAISNADLDRVMMIDGETDRMDSALTPAERGRFFYTLRELRAKYDRQLADLQAQTSAANRAGLQQMAAVLEQLAGVFAREGNYSAARTVERARSSILGPAPTSAVVATPASGFAPSTAFSSGTFLPSASGPSRPAAPGSSTTNFAGAASAPGHPGGLGSSSGAEQVDSLVPSSPGTPGTSSGVKATRMAAPSKSQVLRRSTGSPSSGQGTRSAGTQISGSGGGTTMSTGSGGGSLSLGGGRSAGTGLR